MAIPFNFFMQKNLISNLSEEKINVFLVKFSRNTHFAKRNKIIKLQ